MSEPFQGEIKLLPYTFAPRSYAYCNGQIFPIAQNQALYSLLGTQFGGNGRTDFALPDLQGRAPIGAGQGPGLTPRIQGNRGGYEQIPLTIQDMPEHNHTLHAENANANSVNASGNVLANGSGGGGSLPTVNSGIPVSGTITVGKSGTFNLDNGKTSGPGTLSGGSVGVTNTYINSTNSLKAMNAKSIGDTGNDVAHDNMMPFLSLNYCIAMQGLYPSRS